MFWLERWGTLEIARALDMEGLEMRQWSVRTTRGKRLTMNDTQTVATDSAIEIMGKDLDYGAVVTRLLMHAHEGPALIEGIAGQLALAFHAYEFESDNVKARKHLERAIEIHHERVQRVRVLWYEDAAGWHLGPWSITHCGPGAYMLTHAGGYKAAHGSIWPTLWVALMQGAAQ